MHYHLKTSEDTYIHRMPLAKFEQPLDLIKPAIVGYCQKER